MSRDAGAPVLLHPTHTPQFPAYMSHLVERAAAQLRMQGLGALVRFDWWADGEDVAYTARLDWPVSDDTPAARLVVFNARSGEFVCRSMPGDWLSVDPLAWCHDPAEDEIERQVWQDNKAPARRKRA